MNIKKVDEEPMLIHIKKGTNIHVRSTSETKINSDHVVAVESGLNTVRDARNDTQSLSDRNRKANRRQKQCPAKKSGTVATLADMGAGTALEQIDGGEDIFESYMVMRTLSRPVEGAAGHLSHIQPVKAETVKQIKRVQADKKIGKKVTRDRAAKAAKETSKAAAKTTTKTVAKTAVKETAKTTAKAAVVTAGTATGTVATGVGGVLIGAAAGEAVGVAMDKKDLKCSTRNRMLQFYIAKMRQEESQDSLGKTLKDIILMRAAMKAKYAIRYVGLFLLALFALAAFVSFTIIAVIAIIYGSPFAIFFPSISSSESTQEVLSAYVAEFNEKVNDELTNPSGYDESEKIYVDFEGAGESDNYYDILMVYMVKYGKGNAATDMTDKAKDNLRAVFDDMCSYSLSSRSETSEDDEGNSITTTVKEVRVTLKTYQDMILEYGFTTEEQQMLLELMKSENMLQIQKE